MNRVRVWCPYAGCTKNFETCSGVRKHWENHHPGDVPVLIAEQLSRREKQDESKVESVSEFKDEELITMMGLSSTDSAVDARSAGRFARSSGLDSQPAVPVVLPETNPWLPATGAYFASMVHDIERCEVATKLALSDSGKLFRPVHAAAENYR